MVVSGKLNKAPAAELLVDPFRFGSVSPGHPLAGQSIISRSLQDHAEGEGQSASFAVCAIV
jgi:hypothetical protein